MANHMKKSNQNQIILSFRWLHDNFGSNFRLTEMQSSIGRFQLKKLDDWISLRNRNAKILIEYLSELKQIRVPIPSDNILHAYYKYYCYVNEDCFLTDWNRDRIIKELQKNGFPAYSGSCSEIYLERCFKNIGLYPKII